MDPCGSLWIVVGSLWVVVGSLWVVVDRCGSLWVVPGFSNYADLSKFELHVYKLRVIRTLHLKHIFFVHFFAVVFP